MPMDEIWWITTVARQRLSSVCLSSTPDWPSCVTNAKTGVVPLYGRGCNMRLGVIRTNPIKLSPMLALILLFTLSNVERKLLKHSLENFFCRSGRRNKRTVVFETRPYFTSNGNMRAGHQKIHKRSSCTALGVESLKELYQSRIHHSPPSWACGFGVEILMKINNASSNHHLSRASSTL